MPDDTTAADLERRADEIERLAKERMAEHWRIAHAEAEQLRKAAAILKGTDARTREKFEQRMASLTSARDEHNLSSSQMEAQIVTGSGKGKRRKRRQYTEEHRLAISRGNSTSDCAFRRWLDANDWSATSWSQAHLDPRTKKPRWSDVAVRCWQLPKKSKAARAVPEDAAELIAIESKGAVPADDSVWPSGISRPRRRAAQ